MKKQFKLVIATLVLTFAAFTMNAQSFKKSDKILEGTVSYTKATDVDASYSINPAVGYFVTDKVALGVFGEFGKAGDDKTTNVGAFARCYFMTIGNHCSVFSQADLASNSSTVASVKTTSFAANLGLGANYFISSKLALTMHVANLVSYESADSKSTFTIGFDGVTNPASLAKFGVLYKF